LQLGRIGYVRGIESKLDEIAAANPAMAPFAAQLRAFVGRFELARYMAFLETLAGETMPSP
jgi:hypothetical protein